MAAASEAGVRVNHHPLVALLFVAMGIGLALAIYIGFKSKQIYDPPRDEREP